VTVVRTSKVGEARHHSMYSSEASKVMRLLSRHF